jgi:uncharacterized protein YndB with AHSA1/START domain
MKTNDDSKITVEVTVSVPVEKVWEFWTEPKHIKKWNNASEDWHTPFSENDLKPGGSFLTRMEAKDGSYGFDFGGTYDDVKLHKFISYKLGDGRKVEITFINKENMTRIIESFEPEKENPVELQQKGWQAIIDNFKKYTEQMVIQ